MKKFIIEVAHGDSKTECKQAIQVFLETGSHFLTHAHWGCIDGEHKAWIIADVPTKEDARNIVPVRYRQEAKIVELTRFSLDMDEQHSE